ncbi:MAG: hypothetical protein OCD76_13655 [Reichenbachiella sp.]
MTIEEKKSIFAQRAQEFLLSSEGKKKATQLMSWSRVLVFVLLVIGFVYLVNARELQNAIILLLVAFPVFGQLIRRHNKLKFELKQLSALADINQEELDRVNGNFKSFDQGNTYQDSTHSYAPDLDLFGSNSLFQMINRSEYEGVKNVLATWLKNPAGKEIIEARQEGIKELNEDLDWNQKMIALSRQHNKEKSDNDSIKEVLEWLNRETATFKKPIWSILAIWMVLATCSSVIAYNYYGLAIHWVFAVIVVNTGILSLVFVPLLELTKTLPHVVGILKGYELSIAEIETKSFQSNWLNAYRSKIVRSGQPASKSLKNLRVMVQFLFNRTNMIYPIVNGMFAIDIFLMKAIVRWSKKNADHVESWLNSTNQIGALIDVSAYAYTTPHLSYPTVNENKHSLLAIDMSHPLIPSDKRIPNSFTIDNGQKLNLITGSNMSGKSTFLRTLGVNLVLAQMGAPVSAEKFDFSLMDIFTSMRTQDNLEESISSFYAELLRIKQLLESLNEERPTFYLLDEILKGTNSEDRHKGAIGLINQLSEGNCIGLISTHDIELAELSKANEVLVNYSFNSTIQNDEIIFDYKLTEGACKSFNASKLMEKMGIIKK